MEAVQKPMPHALTAAAILAADDIEVERVDIPEWNGFVYVRGMTGRERDAWEVLASQIETGQAKNIRATLAAYCVCDEHGTRLFNDSQIADLGSKNGRALDRLMPVIKRVNAITDEEIDTIEGN